MSKILLFIIAQKKKYVMTNNPQLHNGNQFKFLQKGFIFVFSEVETTADPCIDSISLDESSSSLSANNNKDFNAQPDSLTAGPTSLQATKIVTRLGGRFGGSRSFCLGTHLALPVDESQSANLPDASKFASGVSDLILHDNLPNATGTFNKLKVVLTGVKNRSSPSSNAPLKR